jgi:hypothetical protein
MYNLTNGQPDASLDRDLFIMGTTTGDWRYYYASSIPKKWLWNTNPEPDGTPDPCRRDKKGQWRVPTVEDWNKIKDFPDNNCEPVPNNDSTRGGIKVSISGEPSFFLPVTKRLLPSGQLSSTEELGYWLNDDSGKTDFSEARAIGELPTGTKDIKKAHGLNIRCVADY